MSETTDTAKSQLDAMLNGGVPFFGENDQEAPTSSDQIFEDAQPVQESAFPENSGFFPPEGETSDEESTEYFSEGDEQQFQNEDLVFSGEENKEETQVTEQPAHSAEYLQGQIDAMKAQGIQPQEAQQPQFTPEQQRFLQAGQELSNLQQNNAPLYNKMLQMVQNEMNGTTVQAPVKDNSLDELEELLASKDYSGIDSAPIKKLIAAQRANASLTQTELQQYKQATGALNQRMNALEADKTTSANSKQEKEIANNVAEYHKISDDLGIKIKPDSRTMTKLMGLMKAGIPVREAFFDVTGKTENDIKAKANKPKPRGISATRRSSPKKKEPGITDARQKLHDDLFGNQKSAKSLFA